MRTWYSNVLYICNKIPITNTINQKICHFYLINDIFYLQIYHCYTCCFWIENWIFMAVKASVHNSKSDKCWSIFTRHGELNSAPKGQIILYRNFAHLIFASCVHISKVNDLKTTWSATHVESYIYWCTITTGSYNIF